MLNVTVFCFLASYVCAFALECRRLYYRSTANRALSLVAATAGLAAHTIYLWNRHAQTDLPPLLSSTHDWLLVLAWMAALTYLILSLADRRLSIGVFLWPLVLIVIGAAYFVSRNPNAAVAANPEMTRVAGRMWAMLHATLLVFGIAAVIFGLVLSLMYLVQHRRLKQKQGRADGVKLPNLEKLARLNRWAVMLAMPLLTLGMLTGLVLVVQSRTGPAPVSLADPFFIVSGGVWLLLMAFFLWYAGRVGRRTSGRQVAWLTVAAFGFLLITLIGLQVLAGATGGTRHAGRGAKSGDGTSNDEIRLTKESRMTGADLRPAVRANGRSSFGKGDATVLCEASAGPFRQRSRVPFLFARISTCVIGGSQSS